MPNKLHQALTDARREGWADWIRCEADERAVRNGCWFDVRAGKVWVDFAEQFCRHTGGPAVSWNRAMTAMDRLDLVDEENDQWAGKPFVLMPWQVNDLIMPLFGWMRDRSSSRRRFKKANIFVAKGNGKSSLMAMLINGTLIMGPRRCEAYSVAQTREQSDNVYGEAAAMAKGSPALDDMLDVKKAVKRIICPERGSFYRVLPGEKGARATEGVVRASLIGVDELHIIESRDLFGSLIYACDKAENGLFLTISTVGVADPTSLWMEEYDYTKGVLDGSLDDQSRFGYIAQADEKCVESSKARANKANWYAANPALGITIDEEDFAANVREAENDRRKLNALLRYKFNIPTAQIDRIIDAEQWKECACKGEFPDMLGKPVCLGVDLASLEDLSAVVAAWPVDMKVNGRRIKYILKSWFWVPEAKVREHEKAGRTHYKHWIDDGWLFEMPGERMTHEPILDHILQLDQDYRVEVVAIDKWGAQWIVPQMQDVRGMEVVEINPQARTVSNGQQTFLTAIIEGHILHDGNPVMTWCCGNVAADEPEDGIIRFNKGKSAGKIDGAVAGAFAVSQASLLDAAEESLAPFSL